MIHNKHIFKFLANAFYVTVLAFAYNINIQSNSDLLKELSAVENKNSFETETPRMSPPTPPDY